MKTTIISVLFAAISLYFGVSQAAGITADSCSIENVRSAIDSAVNEDTVIVPPGTCIWTSVLNVGAKAITLKGSGIGITNIINDLPASLGSQTYLMNFDAHKTIPTRITGFSFIVTSNSTHKRFINVGNTAEPYENINFRIDHNDFIAPADSGGLSAIRSFSVTMLVDHNNIASPYNSEMVRSYGPGEAGWARDIAPGEEKAMYIENNTFTNNGMSYDSNCPCWRFGASSAIQAYDGAVTVIRYNTFVDTQIDQHGSPNIGSRWWEIYKNTLHITNDRTDQDKYMDIRAGSGVIFSNWHTGYFDTRGNVPPIVLREEDSGYPAKYQVGRGKNQSLDPAYIWDNKSPVWFASYSEEIQLDRDYYTVIKPGYRPYTYPHPFTREGIMPTPGGLCIIAGHL